MGKSRTIPPLAKVIDDQKMASLYLTNHNGIGVMPRMAPPGLKYEAILGLGSAVSAFSRGTFKTGPFQSVAFTFQNNMERVVLLGNLAPLCVGLSERVRDFQQVLRRSPNALPPGGVMQSAG